MNSNDPHDDAGNHALDYATDNVEKVMAAMDLSELCAEFDIGLAEGLEVFDEYYSWNGLRDFCLIIAEKAREKCPVIETGIMELAKEGVPWKVFEKMLCAAIRANETYRERMSEKLQEQHRAGEVGDWMGLDAAEEKARDNERS